MENKEIQSLIQDKHAALMAWVNTQDIAKWTTGPAGKWTSGQHVLHIVQSIKALNKAFRYPKFLLKYKFGTSNRETRDFDVVVKRYQERLKAARNAVSPFSRNMPIPTNEEKTALLQTLDLETKKLIRKLSKWKEHDLDTYILPHPLMGRMPVREITMWTAYHAEHHQKILEEKY